MLIATIWAYFFLPETKGRTLEDFDVILYVGPLALNVELQLTAAVAMSPIGLELPWMLRGSTRLATKTMLSIQRRELLDLAPILSGARLCAKDEKVE